MKSTGRYRLIIFLFLFLLGITACFIIMNRRGLNEVEARDLSIGTQKKYFTSIEIEEGDTLWEIAGEYMTPEYRNRQEYINEVRKMNNITGSTILAGSRLFIPYYAQEASVSP